MNVAIRVWLLLILGVVVLWRGLLYLDDRLSSARPAGAAAAATPAAALDSGSRRAVRPAAAHREPAPRAAAWAIRRRARTPCATCARTR